MMAELRSVQTHNIHLFVEHGRHEEYHRRREAEYLIKAKRYSNYTVNIVTKLDKLKTRIWQQYQIDINQYPPYHSCNHEV